MSNGKLKEVSARQRPEPWTMPGARKRRRSEDPRFVQDPTQPTNSGYNANHFRQHYGFLAEMQAEEAEKRRRLERAIGKELKFRTEDAEEDEDAASGIDEDELLRLRTASTSALANERREHRQFLLTHNMQQKDAQAKAHARGVKRESIKKEVRSVLDGEKVNPFFPKKRELRAVTEQQRQKFVAQTERADGSVEQSAAVRRRAEGKEKRRAKHYLQ